MLEILAEEDKKRRQEFATQWVDVTLLYMLSTSTHAPLVSAKDFNIPPTTISSFDISGKGFSDLKIAKPLRKRGAGAAIGEIGKRGNHEIDDFGFPAMIKNHSHPTPLGLIPQSPSEYRGFYSANLEAQGEVA